MIQQWIAWQLLNSITPTCVSITLFVSQVIFSGITLEPSVDRLVTSQLAVADSVIMTQLCRHYWEVKYLQQCAMLLATFIISFLAGQHTVKLQGCAIMCAADDKYKC
jgi:hypothetical protein